jgi:hypothetical protein
MTGQQVAVTAEWARHGKIPGERRGYHLLASSDGVLGSRNFEDALDRFSIGTPDELPQVSVSFLARADQADGTYLALAVHEYLDRHVDATGREIAYTRYFCAPYRHLAPAAVGYLDMYQCFRDVDLPWQDAPPLQLTLPVTLARVPSADDLALPVAALLLAGRTVCVVGAREASVAERLAFIDAVMSLLPYGMRSRMSAATWTPDNAPHRFRLFFSDGPRAARGDRPADLVAHWGRPDRTQLPPEYPFIHDYLAWLRSRVRQPVEKLAELTEEVNFGAKRVMQMLEGAIGITGVAEAASFPGMPADLLHPETVPARGVEGFAERILTGVNDLVQQRNLGALKREITSLRDFAGNQHDASGHVFYQNLIFRCQLLRPELEPLLRSHKLAAPYYGTLLQLAFGLPLDYQGFCALESCLGTGSPPSQPPPRDLLEAIIRAGSRDPRVTAIVHWYLGPDSLREWFRSGQADIAGMIARLAEPWQREHHAEAVCQVVREYVRAMRGTYSPADLCHVLRLHGYLAGALQSRHPDALQHQVAVLRDLVAGAHGDVLRAGDVVEILAGGEAPPTPALLAAVLLLADPDDPHCAGLAKDAFFMGVLAGTDFGPGVESHLTRFIPAELQRHLRGMISTQPVSPHAIAQGRLAISPAGETPAGRVPADRVPSDSVPPGGFRTVVDRRPAPVGAPHTDASQPDEPSGFSFKRLWPPPLAQWHDRSPRQQ